MGNQEVRRLDVPVDQPGRLGVLQAQGRLPDVVARQRHRQRPDVADQLFQVRPVVPRDLLGERGEQPDNK